MFYVSSCVMVLQDDDGETSRSSSVCKRLSLPMVDSSSVIVCLFDLILYIPSTIFQLYRDGSSWVEPVLS